MRITNQMISNNSLRNMQKTMANVDNRTTQMETGKKITKASEDPVVAVRALKSKIEATIKSIITSANTRSTHSAAPKVLFTFMDKQNHARNI